jgi:hypothetical protein
MKVFFALAVVSPESHSLDPILLVGDDGTAFSQCSQVLSRVKTEGAHLSESACPLLLSVKMVAGTMSLSGIFDHFEAKPFGQG